MKPKRQDRYGDPALQRMYLGGTPFMVWTKISGEQATPDLP